MEKEENSGNDNVQVSIWSDFSEDNIVRVNIRDLDKYIKKGNDDK